jgi:hypothetical protein
VIGSEKNGYRLRVIREDGGGRTLVSGPTCCGDPLWSPNGKRIAFYGLTEASPQGESILEVIGIHEQSASPLVKVVVEDPPFSWASDNRRIVLIQSTDQVIYDDHEFRKFASHLEIATLEHDTRLLDDGPVDDEYQAWQPQPKKWRRAKA